MGSMGSARTTILDPSVREFERGPKLRNLVRHVVGITCALLTIRDPYHPRYKPPKVVASGPGWMEVDASSSRDLDRYVDGITVAGGRIVFTKVGKRRWVIHVEGNG